MNIAPEKTEALIFGDNKQVPTQSLIYNNKVLKITTNKKNRGITVHNKLKFEQHNKEKSKQNFKALNTLDRFIGNTNGVSQTLYMRLFKALVLPIMEYGTAETVTATDKATKELDLVRRSAMIKASGCLPSTNTVALEVLTNTLPLNLHMRMKQAQKMVRIVKKTDKDPLKQDFSNWVGKGGI